MTSSRKQVYSGHQCSVYKYYDRHKILIYVGVTSSGIGRNRQHNESKGWWPFVAAQEVEHFVSRDAALLREAELIHAFRPPFNVTHNPDHVEMRAAYLSMALRASQRNYMSLKDFIRAARRYPIPVHRDFGRDHDDRVHFLSYVENYDVMQCVKMSRAFLRDNRRVIGKIVALVQLPPVAQIVAIVYPNIEPLSIGSGEAHLKSLSQKAPYVIELTSVSVPDIRTTKIT